MKLRKQIGKKVRQRIPEHSNACQGNSVMEMIRRILCPTDFSARAELALRYAERLAIQTAADLYVVHSFGQPVEMTVAGQTHPLDLKDQEQLEKVLRDSPLGNRVIRLQHAGDPGEVICWMAQEQNCDLIVMGTHGHGGLLHRIFGSVTEHVLRHARCPVMTIRERVTNEAPLQQPLVVPIKAPRFM